MNAKKHARFFGDGGFVVREARAVRGADFAQRRAALRHDFGNAEAVANFDEFAARDKDFAIASERGEDKQHGGGAIVDDDGGFGAGEALEKLTGMNVAFAARAGFEIVFEIGILRCGAAKFLDGGFGERGAAEIGVEDDAGGVDDGLERLGKDLFDGVGDFVLESDGIERKDDRAAVLGFGGQAGAQIGQSGAGGFEGGVTIDGGGGHGGYFSTNWGDWVDGDLFRNSFR